MSASVVVPARSIGVLKSLWSSLPGLGVLNLGLAVALVPAGLLTAGGLGFLAPAAALVPLAIAAAALWTSGPDGVSRAGVRAALGPGLRVGGGAGAVLSLALATLRLYRATGAPWLLGPLFLDGVAVTLVLVAGVYAVPLASAQRMSLRALWSRSLVAAAGAIPTTLSSLFVLGVGTMLVLVIGPGLLLLLPGPIFFVVQAMVCDATSGTGGDQ